MSDNDEDIWDGRWVDHRWGDPRTRAHIDQPYAERVDEGTGTPVWGGTEPPSPSERSPHRFIPLLAGLIGLALGAAIGVPVGLAHRPDAPPPAASSAPFFPGNNGTGTTLSPDDVAAKVDPSIVDITSRISYRNATAAGTGMILTADGEVLTNNHVIDGATSITATSVTTGRQYRVTVLGTDPTEDVALLKLTNASSLEPITVGDASKVGVGDPVVALGNAGGVGGTPAIASGNVTALDQSITASDSSGRNPQRLTGLIETDAPIRPGDSGGPLSNMSAQVVGMDSAASVNGFGGGTDRGYAIPIQRALDVAHQIESGKGSSTVHIGTRGMIGVQVSALSTGGGAVVESVTSGSPADDAGIRAGDTITAVDGRPVTTADSLGTLIKAHAAGEQVTVSWTSGNGQHHSVRMTLVAGPPD